MSHPARKFIAVSGLASTKQKATKQQSAKQKAPKTAFRCTECWESAPQWAGRCPGCGAWNTLVEDSYEAGGGSSVGGTVIALSDAAADLPTAFPTGVSELDRVLGGGLVKGSVTLLGGEPGIGKSTLVLQVCAGLAKSGVRSLIVSGEESAAQIGGRAQRMGIEDPLIDVLSETDAGKVLAVVDAHSPGVVIVDSVQTLTVPASASAAGSVTQVREVAQLFTSMAKGRDIAVVLIGHVTKEGSLAGPRVLEHLVDTVLEFEGDRHQGLRFLRAAKHRFGSTDEVGVLTMAASGLEPVEDASGLFLDDRHPGISGAVVVPIVRGNRPMLIELQSLVDHKSPLPQPRRVAQGIDASRFSVVVAVLTKRADHPLYAADVFASVVGGLKVNDPGTDLAVALAVASASSDAPIPEDVCAIGEIGLGGEVRRVAHVERRLVEASRMGFKRAIVPVGTKPLSSSKMNVLPVGTVKEALELLRIPKPRRVSKDTEGDA